MRAIVQGTHLECQYLDLLGEDLSEIRVFPTYIEEVSKRPIKCLCLPMQDTSIARTRVHQLRDALGEGARRTWWWPVEVRKVPLGESIHAAQPHRGIRGPILFWNPQPHAPS